MPEMGLYEAMRTTRAVRRLRPDPIADDVLRRVLEAATFGPSGGLYMNPGHTMVNLGGSWRPVKAVELFARALNLFDRDYEEVLGYPAPGRTAYVGARFAVGR